MISLVLTASWGATIMAIFWSRKKSAQLSLLSSSRSILGAVLQAIWLGVPVWAQVPPVPNPPPNPGPPAPLAAQPVQAAPASGSQPLPVAPRFSEESEIPATLLRIPLTQQPLPAQVPGSVSSFVDTLLGNDATFDILVNQA